MITFYTDGSSRGNPGDGGYGVVVLMNNIIEYWHSEQFENVTNNQMELRAIIHALEYVRDKYPEDECIIYSDSAYCVNMCRDWIWNWAKNGWVNSKNKQVENYDLVRELYALLKKDFPNFRIEKCTGHTGNIGNELADALASNNSTKFAKIIKENNIKHKYGIIDLIS